MFSEAHFSASKSHSTIGPEQTVEQAAMDGVPFADVEKRMVYLILEEKVLGDRGCPNHCRILVQL
jgi:hypothetical protein